MADIAAETAADTLLGEKNGPAKLGGNIGGGVGGVLDSLTLGMSGGMFSSALGSLGTMTDNSILGTLGHKYIGSYLREGVKGAVKKGALSGLGAVTAEKRRKRALPFPFPIPRSSADLFRRMSRREEENKLPEVQKEIFVGFGPCPILSNRNEKKAADAILNLIHFYVNGQKKGGNKEAFIKENFAEIYKRALIYCGYDLQ